jgi:hypothetical protein
LGVADSDLRGRLARALEQFSDLLIPFVRGDLDATSFELAFTKRYLGGSTHYDDDVFDVIDRYYSDVEEFAADPALRGPDSLGPKELLASTRELLQRAGMA